MMRAPAHPRRQGSRARAEASARASGERARPARPRPGRGRPRSPRPRRSSATPGQGWARPRPRARPAPSPSHLRPRPAWGWSWPQTRRQRLAGGASQVRAAAFPLRPPLGLPEESGRAGEEWTRVENRGGGQDAAPTPLGRRNFPSRTLPGTGGGGGPARRAVGTPAGSPRGAASSPVTSLCQSVVSSDSRAIVLSAAGHRGWGGQVSVVRGSGERVAALRLLFDVRGERRRRPRWGRAERGALRIFARSLRFQTIKEPLLLAAWLLDPYSHPQMSS